MRLGPRPARLIRLPPRALLAAVLAAATLAGCGSATRISRQDNRIRGNRLTLYVSVPLQGASRVQGQAALNGARLALARIHGRIGRYRVTLRALDDSTAKRGEWDPGQTEHDAKLAIADRTAIGYVGDLNSGASAVSIPLLNRFSIAQVSPASTAVGLTTDGPGSDPGEPEKYYPTEIRTFARVVPSDAIEASVQVRLQLSEGCRTTYELDDGEVDGFDTSASFADLAQKAGLTVVQNQIYDTTARSYTALAKSVEHSGADCVLISAITDNQAVALTEAVEAEMPKAHLFGTAGLAETTYADPAQGGIPAAIDPHILLTSPMLAPSLYPASGREFLTAYRARYGAPEPDAIFGYAAAELLLASIERATDDGRTDAVRSRVAAAMMQADQPHSPIGPYRISSDGNTTLRSYGIYRIVDGRLAFLRAAQG